MAEIENEKRYETLLKQVKADHQKEMDEIRNSHRQDVKRTYMLLALIAILFVAVVGIALVFIDSSFIAELRAGNVSSTKNTDFLEIVLPIVAVVGIAIIAFLGMNRLKDMDAQMDRMQSSITASMEKEIQRITALRQDLADHIDVAITSQTKNLDTITQECKDQLKKQEKTGMQRLSDSQASVLQTINAQIEELDNKISDGRIRFEKFSEKYEWLLPYLRTADTSLLKEIGSVFDVHNLLERLWAGSDKPDHIVELTKRLVAEVTNKNANLHGDVYDYHNLAAECARHSFYGSSCDVCKAGLKYFPEDIDLLSDWIKYGTKMGEVKTVENEPLQRLLKIDKALWNWRAFDFCVDFYMAIGQFDNAEKLAKDFIKYIPYEERSYLTLAGVYQRQHREDKNVEQAIAVLQKVLSKSINCPMCANLLAEILSDHGRLDEALAAADRAIEELAQEHPSVNYAYVFYRRALILDRMAFRKRANGADGKKLAQQASIDYRVATQSDRLGPTMSSQARVRLDLLKTYFEIEHSGGDDDKIAALSKWLAMLPDDDNGSANS